MHLHLGVRAGGKVLEGSASLLLRILGRPSGCIGIPDRVKQALQGLGRYHGAATAASKNCEGVMHCIASAACGIMSMISYADIEPQSTHVVCVAAQETQRLISEPGRHLASIGVTLHQRVRHEECDAMFVLSLQLQESVLSPRKTT